MYAVNLSRHCQYAPTAGGLKAQELLEQMLLCLGNVNIRITCHLISGAVRVAAVLIMVSWAQAQNLFVLDNLTDASIYEFTPDGTRSTFASGLGASSGLAIDKAGNVFVSSSVTSNGVYIGCDIIKIKPDGTQITFSGFTNGPNVLAVNSAGNLFAAQAANYNGDIYEFTTNGTPSIFATGVDGWIEGLTFNSAGDLFVSCNGSESIVEITPGGVTSTFAIGSGLVEPYELVFNDAGDLFVADRWPPGHIYEYTPDGVQSTFVSGLYSPLAIDSAGNLYVAEGATSNSVPIGVNIIKIKPDGTQSIFASGLSNPQAFAFQPVPELQAAWTNGTLQVNVSMPSPYYSTILQASTDLVNWVNIYTNIPPYTFTDSTATTGPRFYRARLGP